jgi:hypothetical protein
MGLILMDFLMLEACHSHIHTQIVRPMLRLSERTNSYASIFRFNLKTNIIIFKKDFKLASTHIIYVNYLLK